MCRRVGQLKALCAGVAIKFETEGRVKKKTKKGGGRRSRACCTIVALRGLNSGTFLVNCPCATGR